MPALYLALGTKQEWKNKSTWGSSSPGVKRQTSKDNGKLSNSFNHSLAQNWNLYYGLGISEEKKEMCKQITENHRKTEQFMELWLESIAHRKPSARAASPS